MKKHNDIWENLNPTQSNVKNWINEYCNLHLKNEINMNSSIGTQSNEDFSNMLPIVKRITTQTIGMNLVDVKPLKNFGNTLEEIEKIERDVNKINRDRKLDSVLEDKEYEEFKIEEHELFKEGTKPQLFYMDFIYNNISSKSPTFSQINKLKKD
jgi:6-pyruvoyl-tetrahydropterin synthase